MSLNSKIINIIDQEIKKFGTFQTNISQTASTNNSGVNPVTIDSFDPKTKTFTGKTSSGTVITGIQPGSKPMGPGVQGYVFGKQFQS